MEILTANQTVGKKPGRNNDKTLFSPFNLSGKKKTNKNQPYYLITLFLFVNKVLTGMMFKK